MKPLVAALMLTACAAPSRQAGGIVSVNPCADAMLVRLVTPNRIAAISHYSLDPAASSIPRGKASPEGRITGRKTGGK